MTITNAAGGPNFPHKARAARTGLDATDGLVKRKANGVPPRNARSCRVGEEVEGWADPATDMVGDDLLATGAQAAGDGATGGTAAAGRISSSLRRVARVASRRVNRAFMGPAEKVRRGSEFGMSRWAWRLRGFAYRALPHAPMKRLAYGAALMAAIGLGVVFSTVVAIGAIAMIILVRWFDLRHALERRRHIPMTRAYFFEGRGEHDLEEDDRSLRRKAGDSKP